MTALAVLLAAAAIHELGSARDPAAGERRRRRALAALSGSLGWKPGGAAERRLLRAGLAHRFSPAALLLARLTSVAVAIPPALAAAPAAPGRLGILITLGIPAAAFFAPDAVLDRIGARRRAAVADSLPDTLDLMAVGALAGRSASPLLADAARGSAGPLRDELAGAVAALECGASQAQVLRALRRGGGGPELSALAAALERSRRHGSPLSRNLHEQSRSLRQAQRRRIGERASKAAPKIQLVVALLLVPSVLLIVAAAILAGSDSLLTIL